MTTIMTAVDLSQVNLKPYGWTAVQSWAVNTPYRAYRTLFTLSGQPDVEMVVAEDVTAPRLTGRRIAETALRQATELIMAELDAVINSVDADGLSENQAAANAALRRAAGLPHVRDCSQRRRAVLRAARYMSGRSGESCFSDAVIGNRASGWHCPWCELASLLNTKAAALTRHDALVFGEIEDRRSVVCGGGEKKSLAVQRWDAGDCFVSIPGADVLVVATT